MCDSNSGAHRPQAHLFWHVFACEGRVDRIDEIVSRQWGCIRGSGLLDAITGIHVGVVGEASSAELDKVLEHPKVRLTQRQSHGKEEVTTQALWSFAATCEDDTRLAYIHARGMTRNPRASQADSCAEDWTRMMEFFVIERWAVASSALNDHEAAGCEMWSYRGTYHYSGNFWWARAGYIKRLPPPEQFVPDRRRVGEFWVLSLADVVIPKERFCVLHRTTKHKYRRGVIDSYRDHYPRSLYSMGGELPNSPLDGRLYHGEPE